MAVACAWVQHSELSRNCVGAPRGLYRPKNFFMPRVGFAYSPFRDGKTSVRGGFGMYYDRIEGNIIFPLESNPPFVDSASFNNGNLSNIRGGSAAALAPFAALTTINPHMNTLSTMNFSLGIQHEFPWGIFVEATAVGDLGRHLTRQQDINAVPFDVQVANSTLPTPLGINALRPYKGYTNINQRTADGTSHYYAGQFYAAKRKGDLLFAINYTYGKVLTDANVLTEAAEDGPFDRHFNYGPATFDRRHVFVASYTYALPFFRELNGWAKSVLDGFELSGLTRIQSGRPFTITASSNIGNQGATRRADLVPGVDPYLTDPNDSRVWLNPAAFAIPPTTRLGNSGVGIVTGPWYSGTDFSIRKLFKFSETMNLRLEADVFNAFNRNNFSNVQTVLTNASFGKFRSGAWAGPRYSAWDQVRLLIAVRFCFRKAGPMSRSRPISHRLGSIEMYMSSQGSSTISLVTDWDRVPVEQVADGIKRQMVVGVKVMVCRFTFAPFVVTDVHTHPHEQITLVMAGKVKFTIGDQSYIAAAGDVLHFPPNTRHGAAILDEEVTLIDIFSPSGKTFSSI